MSRAIVLPCVSRRSGKRDPPAPRPSADDIRQRGDDRRPQRGTLSAAEKSVRRALGRLVGILADRTGRGRSEQTATVEAVRMCPRAPLSMSTRRRLEQAVGRAMRFGRRQRTGGVRVPSHGHAVSHSPALRDCRMSRRVVEAAGRVPLGERRPSSAASHSRCPPGNSPTG